MLRKIKKWTVPLEMKFLMGFGVLILIVLGFNALTLSAQTKEKGGTTKDYPDGIKLSGDKKLELTGDVRIVDSIELEDSSQLIIRDAKIKMESKFAVSPVIQTREKSKVVIENSLIEGDCIQVSLFGNSSIDVNGLDFVGEFFLYEKSKLIMKNSLAVTVSVSAQTKAFVSDSGILSARFEIREGKWKFENLKSLKMDQEDKRIDFKYNVPDGWEISISNTKVTSWWFDVWEYADITLNNVQNAIIGLWFSEHEGNLKNLKGGKNITRNYKFGQTKIKLSNVSMEISPWSLYLSGHAKVNISSSVIGEVIVSEDAILKMNDCETEAAFLWTEGENAYIEITRTTFTQTGGSEINAHPGKIIIRDSTIQGVGVASDNGYIEIINSPTPKYVRAINNGKVVIKNSGKISEVAVEPQAIVEIDGKIQK